MRDLSGMLGSLVSVNGEQMIVVAASLDRKVVSLELMSELDCARMLDGAGA